MPAVPVRLEVATASDTGRRRNGHKLWRLDHDTLFDIGFYKTGSGFTVPAGFEFDLSVPRLIAWALPVDHMRLAAAMHDYARQQPSWPLWFTNLIFLDAMRARGVSEPARTLAWLAVRTNKNR